jgi:fatty-acyl-CoA synthase
MYMQLIENISLGNYIGQIAKRYAKRTAITYLDKSLSYAELWHRSTLIAKGLLANGVQHGTHVGIWANDRPNTVLCMLALLRIGAVGVMLSTTLPEQELQKRLVSTDIEYLLFDEGYKEIDFPSVCTRLPIPKKYRRFFIGTSHCDGFKNLDKLIRDGQTVSDETLQSFEDAVIADDTDLMLFTSGSTSEPRAVMTTHYARLNTALMQAESIQATEEDRYCVAMPIYHCFSLTSNVLAALTTGACVCFPENRRTATLLTMIQREKCTVFSAVPTLFSAILARKDLENWDLSPLRTGMIGGSTYPPKLFREICNRLGYTLLSSLGQTEATAGITASTLNDSLEIRANTVGRFWEHVEGRIVDPKTGRDVPQGICGEICIRGFNVMKGYYKDQALTENIFYDGQWLRTGDLAWQDKEGNLHLTGRLKEVIIRGGENIAPGEVECVLAEHPLVEQVKVVGIPDDHYGEEVCAVVISKCSIKEDELRSLISGRLESFKEPRYYVFLDQLPLTMGGKVDTKACKEHAISVVATRQVAQ